MGNYKIVNLDSYQSARTKLLIECTIHGQSLKRPLDMMKGHFCKACHIDSLKTSYEEFVERFKKVHGERYSYPDGIVLENSKQK